MSRELENNKHNTPTVPFFKIYIHFRTLNCSHLNQAQYKNKIGRSLPRRILYQLQNMSF